MITAESLLLRAQIERTKLARSLIYAHYLFIILEWTQKY